MGKVRTENLGKSQVMLLKEIASFIPSLPVRCTLTVDNENTRLICLNTFKVNNKYTIVISIAIDLLNIYCYLSIVF